MGCATLWSVLAMGAVLRAFDIMVDPVLLTTYEIAIIAISAALVADDWYSRWRPASLAALAIDLGELGPHSLRDAIAQALRDPSIRIGFVNRRTGLVDEAGNPADLVPRPGRMVTELSDGDRTLATIEHDSSVPLDPALLGSVTSLIEIALSNLRLEAEVNDRIADVESSRLRLLTVADAERGTLANRIQTNVQARLERAEALIGGLRDPGDLPGGSQPRVRWSKTSAAACTRRC
jgi:hypothetical protein